MRTTSIALRQTRATTALGAGNRGRSRVQTIGAQLLVSVIVLAAFGPYLVGSIRTEQLLVYTLAVLSLPAGLTRFDVRGGRLLLVAWLAYIVVASLAVLFPDRRVQPYEPGVLLAGYDNILLPIAMLIIIWTWVTSSDAQAVLKLVCKMLAVIMAANGVLAVISTRVDISDALRPFWTAGGGEFTVAENAAALGRFTGIFNQPAEAGILYGLAGIAAIYVWRNRPVLAVALVCFIALGGLISVSKVFIFGGLPAIVIAWFGGQRRPSMLVGAAAFAVAVVGVIQSGLLSEWTGANYLARLFGGSDGEFLNLYSAGRFSAESTLTEVSSAVLAYSPVSGVGAAGWTVPYDGAIAESLIVGGLIGTALYMVVLIRLFVVAKRQSKSLRLFALLFAFIVVSGAFGFSPLTANRVSTITWMLIALLVVHSRERASRAL